MYRVNAWRAEENTYSAEFHTVTEAMVCARARGAHELVCVFDPEGIRVWRLLPRVDPRGRRVSRSEVGPLEGGD